MSAHNRQKLDDQKEVVMAKKKKKSILPKKVGKTKEYVEARNAKRAAKPAAKPSESRKKKVKKNRAEERSQRGLVDAEMIVTYVLTWIETAGHLEGRKGAKRVTFSALMDLSTGKESSVMDKIIDNVAHFLDERDTAKVSP